jgi:hypothetical protein
MKKRHTTQGHDKCFIAKCHYAYTIRFSPNSTGIEENTHTFSSKNMADGTINIYHHPNPEIKSFLTREDLFPPLVGLFKNPFDETANEDLKRMGVFGSHIVKDIMILSGVREIRVKPKEIRLTKEENASWDDIEARVCQILDRALRKKQIKRIK